MVHFNLCIHGTDHLLIHPIRLYHFRDQAISTNGYDKQTSSTKGTRRNYSGLLFADGDSPFHIRTAEGSEKSTGIACVSRGTGQAGKHS